MSVNATANSYQAIQGGHVVQRAVAGMRHAMASLRTTHVIDAAPQRREVGPPRRTDLQTEVIRAQWRALPR